jgi:DNA-binding SARP family transcriptional activator
MNKSSASRLAGQDENGRYFLGLLGGFEMSRSGQVLPEITAGSQRLLIFLALRPRAITRTSTASILWPDVSEDRAHSSLRSAISRLPRPVQGSVLVTSHDLRLAENVDVDFRASKALANRILDAGDAIDPEDLDFRAIAALSTDLVPDCYDDWAIIEAESWRQLRLHALEAIAGHLLSRGRFGTAAGAALLAIQAEPLRESAHAMLVRIHIAEGNQSEALATFSQYRDLLQTELGLEPTNLLSRLVVRQSA